MLAATGIAIFLIPSIFYLVEKFSMRFGKKHAAQASSTEAVPAAGD
jgi:hypothetical protein